MKEKYYIQIILIILIIAGIIFSARPSQAGFFDWFSWSRIKSAISSKEDNLPASISEPLNQPKELPESNTASAQPENKDTDKTQREEKIEKEQITVIKEVVKELPVEKVVYQDNPQQKIIIEEQKKKIWALENQIEGLIDRIKNLEIYAKTLEENLKPTETLREEDKYMLDYTEKISQLKNTKIKYLGFIKDWDSNSKAWQTGTGISYRVSFIIDTIIPAEVVNLSISNGGQATYKRGDVNNKIKNYYNNELFFDFNISNNDFVDNNPTVKVYFRNKYTSMLDLYLQKTFSDEHVVLPEIPKFNSFDEFVAWYDDSIKDTRLEKCEEYRGKEFNTLFNCIKNL